MRKKVGQFVMRAVPLLFLLLPAMNAGAASFDCGKATTKVEKMICGDVELSKMDEELNGAYKTAQQNEKQADSVRQAQKAWLKERNRCSDVACMKLAYERRLHVLTESLVTSSSGHIQAAQLNTAASEKVIEKGRWAHFDGYFGSSGRTLCESLLKRLNSYTWTNEEIANNIPYAVMASSPVWKDPPWQDLDKEKHLDLLQELIKYQFYGANRYFNRENPYPIPGGSGDLEVLARKQQWAREKFRLQIWRARLVEWLDGKPAPPGEQTIINVDYAYSPEEQADFERKWPGKPWAFDRGGELFVVTDDLKGPHPGVAQGSRLHNVLLYGGKPYFLFPGGPEMSVAKPSATYCTFIFETDERRK